MDQNVNLDGFDYDSSGYPAFNNFQDCRAHCASTYGAAFFNWKPEGNGDWTHRSATFHNKLYRFLILLGL